MSPASSALQVDSLPLGLRGSPENKRHTSFSVVSLHYPQLTKVNTFLGNLLNSVKCNTRAHSWLIALARHLFGFRTFPICSNTDEPRGFNVSAFISDSRKLSFAIFLMGKLLSSLFLSFGYNVSFFSGFLKKNFSFFLLPSNVIMTDLPF